MKAEFHQVASEEIVETTAYHEGEVPGLGASFIAEVERVVDVLRDQPSIGQRVGEEFRRILLAKYSVFLNLQHRDRQIMGNSIGPPSTTLRLLAREN